MKVYYDPIKEIWYHKSDKNNILLGSNLHYVSSNHETFGPAIPFLVKLKDKKIGPLIGILSSEAKGLPFKGNGKNFIRIDEAVKKNGGILFVFTPSGFKDEHVNGFTYLPSKNKWLKVKAPLPDVVYNRIPFRKDEKMKNVQKLLQTLRNKNIPYFNPNFFNKWDIYNELMTNKKIKKNLPHTTLLCQPEDLLNMLQKYKSVYLKPINGAKGNGICSVFLEENLIKFKTDKETKTYTSFQQFWDLTGLNLLEIDYIVQERIQLSRFDSRPYDFRALAHFLNNEWKISGIGVRIGKKDSLTTHVPKGGSVLPVHEVIEDVTSMCTLIRNVGKQLQLKYPNLSEISLDIGKTDRNHYYLFEVNSKPMVFDEPHIKINGLKNLASVFYEQSDFI